MSMNRARTYRSRDHFGFGEMKTLHGRMTS